MPIVAIYTKPNPPKQIHSKLVWAGELEIIPRVGEHITIYDGWASCNVIDVFHELYNNSVLIIIPPDYSDEYPDLSNIQKNNTTAGDSNG